jgi:hypothetical protein
MGAKDCCCKHALGPDDDEWKVVLEELTHPDDDERRCEPFEGQVCPLCFLHMRDRLKSAKRRLKVEARQAISLRTQADQNQKIVDAVIQLVFEKTGKDARKLAKKKYQSKGQAGAAGALERGVLVNILPNLIAEAVNAGRKSDVEKEEETAG